MAMPLLWYEVVLWLVSLGLAGLGAMPLEYLKGRLRIAPIAWAVAWLIPVAWIFLRWYIRLLHFLATTT